MDGAKVVVSKATDPDADNTGAGLTAFDAESDSTGHGFSKPTPEQSIFPHRCPGPRCAICAWVRPRYAAVLEWT